jgi:hypothetical protein
LCPHILLFNGFGGSFLQVKRSGREVNRWTPSSAPVKNEWKYTSHPPISLHGVERGDFTVTFYPMDVDISNMLSSLPCLNTQELHNYCNSTYDFTSTLNSVPHKNTDWVNHRVCMTVFGYKKKTLTVTAYDIVNGTGALLSTTPWRNTGLVVNLCALSNSTLDRFNSRERTLAFLEREAEWPRNSAWTLSKNRQSLATDRNYRPSVL